MEETEKYDANGTTAPYGADLMDMQYLLWRAERMKRAPVNIYVGAVTLNDIIERQRTHPPSYIDDDMKFMGVHVAAVPDAIGVMLTVDKQTKEKGENDVESKTCASNTVQAGEQRVDPAVDDMVGGQFVLDGVREGGRQTANHGTDADDREKHRTGERDVGGTTGGTRSESRLGEETEIWIRGINRCRAWWGGFGRRARRRLADACKSLHKGR